MTTAFYVFGAPLPFRLRERGIYAFNVVHIKNRAINTLTGEDLGTHRFQRAVSAGGALRSSGPSNRDCTLEAMRTQGPPDSATRAFI
jgi:hypothetical protein